MNISFDHHPVIYVNLSTYNSSGLLTRASLIETTNNFIQFLSVIARYSHARFEVLNGIKKILSLQLSKVHAIFQHRSLSRSPVHFFSVICACCVEFR